MEEQPQETQKYNFDLIANSAFNFNKSKLIWTIISIIIFTGLIATFYFIFTNDSDNDSERAVENNEESQHTLSEIMEQGKEKGLNFCENIERGDLKKDCIESYLLNKAKEELDASICRESDNEIFVQRCQYNTIIPEVAKKYNEESAIKNDTTIVPSNIDLCSQIDDEYTRELCLNPETAIEEDYHLLD